MTLLLSVTVVLALAAAASLLLGSHPIAPSQVWDALVHGGDDTTAAVVRGQRLPRTAAAVLVGAALGLAGAVMQALTRNPLADPGILGVNAGASLFVVLAVVVAGTSSITFYLWFALAGAAIASAAVHVLAGAGRASAGPTRLVLAGVAVSAALTALVQALILTDQEAFNEFRTWVTGSLEGRGVPVLEAVLPVVAVGLVLGLALGPALGTLTLGEETARGLGVHVGRTRLLAVVAVALLCGGATAAVGPVGFVGLGAPIVARSLVGHDQRWVGACSVLLGALWLLAADVVGRLVLAPQEVGAGVVAAVAGAPAFVAVVRRRRVPAL